MKKNKFSVADKPDQATPFLSSELRTLIQRRQLVAGTGSALLLSALAACGGGSDASSGGGGGASLPDTTPMTSSVTGVVDAKQIGGSNLTTRSAYQNSAKVDEAGAFTTTVSQKGAQMLVVTDGAGQARGLAVSLPGVSPRVDAASTALTLLFMTPGILTTTPDAASQTLGVLQRLASFNALSQYLTQNLPTSSVATLASGVRLEALKAACIEDYQAAIGIKKATFVTQLSGAKESSLVDAAFTNAAGTPASVTLSNFAFRYVSLIREELSALDFQVTPPAFPNLTGTTNPTGVSNVLNGVNTISLGNLLNLGPGSVGSGLDKPPVDLVKNPDLMKLRYWVCGPGRASTIALPANIHLKDFGDAAFGTSILFYVVFPLLDFCAGALALKESNSNLQAVALTMWAGASKGINALNLVTAFDSWTPENPGGALSVASAATDLTISIASVVIAGLAGPLTDAALLTPATWTALQKAAFVLSFIQSFFGASNLGLAVTSWASTPFLDKTTLPLNVEGYTVKNIDATDGYFYVASMNDKGQIAGIHVTVNAAKAPTGDHLSIYDDNKLTDIVTHNSVSAGITAPDVRINNNSQILYNDRFESLDRKSVKFPLFLYDSVKKTSENISDQLPEVYGITGIQGVVEYPSINDQGKIAGISWSKGGEIFTYDTKSVPRSFKILGRPANSFIFPNGSASLEIYAINNADQIYGSFLALVGNRYLPGLFLYENGKFTDLSLKINPDGKMVFENSRNISGLNNKGDLLGRTTTGYFVYRSNGKFEMLPFEPHYINDSGDILGRSGDGSQPVLYRGGVIIDLKTATPAGTITTSSFPQALNNAGQILLVDYPSNLLRTSLLTPNRVGTRSP